MESKSEPVSLDGFAIIGGGLASCLLACYLRRRGIAVDVFEARPDMRNNHGLAGRSINLVLTSRGMDALERVGLLSSILKLCTPVYGRTLHLLNGETAYQAYGPDESYCNYSISRSELNIELMNAAEALGAVFHFEEGLDHLDVKTNTIITYTRGPNGHPRAHAYRAKHIVGADGAGSRTRQALKLHLGSAMSDEGTPLGAGYKELLMPLGANGKPSMDVRSLHIWPRGSHFLMALPNKDGSFTMTLYLPVKGDISFESIKTTEQVIEYFKRFYPDALPLMPALAKDWRSHPQGFLGTVRAHPWHVDDKVVLLGDAAHAITPFFGQGCNAAFEGVRVLDAALTRHKDVADAYSEFDALHKPNADAIAQMAVENYVEMMQKTGDQHFLLQKALEVELAHRFPSYLSRYAMVTHTLVPYAACIAVGDAQQRILDTLCPQGTQTLEGVDYKKAAAMVEKDLAAALKANKVVQGDLRDVSRELVLGATKTAKL